VKLERRLLSMLAGVASVACGQGNPSGILPFTLVWTKGICIGCKTAAELGRIQFTSRSEAWAVGYAYPPPGSNGAGDFVVVHTRDAGNTWRELSQTRQHAGDPDGPPAFSFLDTMRGWIAWWNPADEAKMISTRDGGRHWQEVSGEVLQKVRFFDDDLGYGAEVTAFLRTKDGGRHWVETQIPHIRFIDRMLFLTPDVGWLAGTSDNDAFLFRTLNGGQDWESLTAPGAVRDLFFLDQNRGWVVTYNESWTYLFSTRDGGKTWVPDNNPLFSGKAKLANVVRFLSEKNGFVFEQDEAKHHGLLYTTDGGAHWRKQNLPRSVYDCQVFEGDLLCDSGGFRVLSLHPR
jgi:photosystem II stability/assembly factor-like uncharacterized protein